MWQGFYLAEAALLAEHVFKDGVDQLHNHFGDQAATVRDARGHARGSPVSMTVHGSAIFFERDAALDVKAEAAKFVACISDFTRSQVMIFTPEAQWPKLHVVHCGVAPERFAQDREARATSAFSRRGNRPARPGEGRLDLVAATAAAGVPNLSWCSPVTVPTV